MMQREVAQRIAAPPGVSDYGPLSAFTQLHAQVTELFTLPPSAFNPPPEVYSTVLRLDFAPRFAELGVDPEGFNKFLRASFMQKRKTLANNLRAAGYTAAQLEAAWPTSIPPQARSEAVPLEAMAELYRALTLGVLKVFTAMPAAFQQMPRLALHTLHHAVIINQRLQHRRNVLHFNCISALQFFHQCIHLHVKPQAVKALAVLQPFAHANSFCDGLKCVAAAAFRSAHHRSN